jgi:diadenosine tetraphosphatase ApaH/serine/threonine PP2A family protein phosphatase
MEWTRQAISDETRAWLAALPERLELEDFTLVHGSPRDPIWEYVTSTPVARAGIAAMGTRFGLHGHTHVPVAYLEDDGHLETMSPGAGSVITLDGHRALLNPGSVGQPRDGIPTAAWLLLDTAAGTATWHRTAYDVGAVQRAMEAVGLPERLVARLAYGL